MMLIEAISIIVLYTLLFLAMVDEGIRPGMVIFLLSIPLTIFIVSETWKAGKPLDQVEKQMEEGEI